MVKPKCPDCGTEKIRKAGVDILRSGKKQLLVSLLSCPECNSKKVFIREYQCGDCGRRFSRSKRKRKVYKGEKTIKGEDIELS